MANSSKEYELLRSEMLSSYSSIQASIATIFTVTVSILCFSFGTQNRQYFVCLIPLFIIVPLYLRSQRRRKSIALLGAYLYVFHEGKDKDFMWERRHHALETLHYSNCMLYKHKLSVIMPYCILVIICGIASWVKFSENRDVKGVLIRIIESITGKEVNSQYYTWESMTLIFGGCFLALFFIYSREEDFITLRNTYIKKWEQIKQDEEASV